MPWIVLGVLVAAVGGAVWFEVRKHIAPAPAPALPPAATHPATAAPAPAHALAPPHLVILPIKTGPAPAPKPAPAPAAPAGAQMTSITLDANNPNPPPIAKYAGLFNIQAPIYTQINSATSSPNGSWINAINFITGPTSSIQAQLDGTPGKVVLNWTDNSSTPPAQNTTTLLFI